MSSSKHSRYSRTITAAAWLISLTAMACAVATEPEMNDDQPTAGKSSSAGSSSSAGKSSSAGNTSSPFGGTTSETGGTTSETGGTSSTSAGTSSGGTLSTAGKGGTSSSGGKGGSTSTGGAAGSSSTGGMMTNAGAGGSGTGGSSPTGCGANIKAWKNADPNLTIAAGEVVQWMGKRYKATKAIAYPNTECAPDKPVDWCKDWFTADGDC